MQDADGQAHSALSYLYLIERRFDEALEAGRQAVANRPSCAYANCFYGNVLHYCGEQDGAIHHIKLAMRVQPLHPPFYLHMLALAYRAKGELNSAVVTAKQALELTPNDVANRIVLTSAYVGLGRQDLAEESAAEIKRIDPLFSVTQFANAQPYRDSGLLRQIRFRSPIRGIAELAGAGSLHLLNGGQCMSVAARVFTHQPAWSSRERRLPRCRGSVPRIS